MKKAAALSYRKDTDYAPKVVASGHRTIAEAIIEKAKAYDIPIFKNEALAAALTQMELNSTIPRELYQSVAELFSWLASIEPGQKSSS